MRDNSPGVPVVSLKQAPQPAELLVTIQDECRRNEQLTHRLDLLLKRVYGPWADTLDPRQLSLFEGPPAEPLPIPLPEPEVATTTVKHNGHGRRKLPENLKRETEVIDVPESVKQATGGALQKIGEEISEKLDYTPSSLFVRRIVRPKYVVRFPDKDQPGELRIAELPPDALPKSKAAPGLVADVIVSKLVDHLPLYRQEQRYTRQGADHPRIRVREADLDAQVLAIFGKMRIDDDEVRDWFRAVLMSQTKDSQNESRAQRVELTRQESLLVAHQDKLFDLRLHDEIDE